MMTGKHMSPLFYRILALGWMGLIFMLSAQSSLPVPDIFSAQDKAEHFIAYAVLGLFYARALAPHEVRSLGRVYFIAILVALYGISDEYHQSFVPGRDASGWDALADALGGWLAAQVLYWRDSGLIRFGKAKA